MSRRTDIDIIKGIAIIAIVLYHIGILPYGYLGVDAFLVVAGWLTLRKLFHSDRLQTVRGVLSWFVGRLFRLAPIILAACLLGLTIGYFVMLPDDYESLAEGVVASDLYANNILAVLTTKNYWDVVNDYKPLMQTWYLGVLMQIYAIVAIIGIIRCLFLKYAENSDRVNRWMTTVCAILGLASLFLFIFDDTAYTIKYYLPQYRYWEFALGGIVGIYSEKFDLSKIFSKKLVTGCWCAACLLLVALLCFDCKSVSEANSTYTIVIGMKDIEGGISSLRIICCIISAFLSTILLTAHPAIEKGNLIATIGKMSLSIFIWHQFILAFMRYTIMETLTVSWLLVIVVLIALISVVSYKSVEKINRLSSVSVVTILICWILTTACGFTIYEKGGVVRDVPELGIRQNDPSTYRSSEYVDRFYNYRLPFTTDKKHVLVIGNSYSRDFANILYEYDRDGKLEIAYLDYRRLSADDLRSVDYVFVFGEKKVFLDMLPEGVDCTIPVYGISTKYYGKNLGLTYSHRGQKGYYRQTIQSNELCDSINETWKRTYDNGHFIDLMETIRREDGTIPLFTADSMIISFDCRHLTQGGCRYYAKIIDFDKIFYGDNEKVAEIQ